MRTGHSKNMPLFRYAFKKAKKARTNSSIYSWLVVMSLAETAPSVYWKVFHSMWNPGEYLKGHPDLIGNFIHKKIRYNILSYFDEYEFPITYTSVMYLNYITSMIAPFTGILSRFSAKYVGDKAKQQYNDYVSADGRFTEIIKRNWRKVNDARRKNKKTT